MSPDDLTDEQMKALYQIIDGEVPQAIRELSDDELLNELTED